MINVAWMSVPFLFLLFLTCFSVNAQSSFAVLGEYNNLKTAAKTQGKLMFLVVHQRDESFEPLKTPVSKKTKTYIDQKFVSGIVQVEREDIHHPLNKAFYLSTPVHIFTDDEGYPILRYNSPIKDEKTLLQLVDSAYALAQGETLGKLVKSYQKGKRSGTLLREILTRYQEMDYYANQSVLKDYLGQLTIQELNNFETVVFLLKSGPVYNDNVYKLAYTNSKMVDSLYASLPLPTRVEINNRIIRQTFRQALEDGNYDQVIKLQRFVRGTWTPNYLRGEIGAGFYSMEYKRLVKDTVGYIAIARNYYNNNHYHLSADSLARIDYAVQKKKTIAPYRMNLNRVQTAEFEKWYENQRVRYNQEQAQSLSYGARQLLVYAEDNSDALFDALRWQKKAIEQSPRKGQYHHTLALLLYKLGFYAEAKAELERAKEFYKPNPIRYEETKRLLKEWK